MNSTRPQDWSSQQSTWQPKAWHRTPALQSLMPVTPYSGAASGRQWTHGYAAEQFALTDALDTPVAMGAMGDVFAGCTDPIGMTAVMASAKYDSFWKGAGMGVVMGLTIAGAAIYFIRR